MCYVRIAAFLLYGEAFSAVYILIQTGVCIRGKGSELIGSDICVGQSIGESGAERESVRVFPFSKAIV